ncbi:MAG TPA: 3-dehydroquinate synthase [Candidatus Hypogeohydataceae bacterium YC40]
MTRLNTDDRQLKTKDMKTIKVKLGARSYNIFIASGLLKELGRLLGNYGNFTKVLILTDKNIEKFYGPIVAENLSTYKPKVVALEPGEGQKNLSTVESLYHKFLEHGIDRKSLIVAVGGGVVGDIAGYAAATFMRGIPYVQVPTTMVAQVDSSIGGKTAVNLPEGKNLVGCFYQPRAVFIDTETLKTLPVGEVTEGMVEVIKYGVIRDPSLFSFLEEHLTGVLRLEQWHIERLMTSCCKIKARVVSKDEREETGLRSILNYGHTLGHALEALGGYKRYRQGQAVAMGTILATKIAMRMGLAGEYLLGQQKGLLSRVGAPTDYNIEEVKQAFELLYRDKKAIGGRLRFVLPVKIGKVILRDVSPEVIKEIL